MLQAHYLKVLRIFSKFSIKLETEQYINNLD